MSYRVHGVVSLLVIFGALILGLVVISWESSTLAGLYGGLLLVSSLLIIFSFCTSCRCGQDSCGHVFPGMIAKIFPGREGPYTALDFIATGTAILVMVGFPQYWLWEHTAPFIIFWILVLISVIDIRRFVCVSCENSQCHLCSSTEGLK